MSRDAARLEVRRAVEATGLGRLEFAKRAKVDAGTLIDMLEGTRWPQSPTRRKIEQALGWPAGRISDLADGIDADASVSSNLEEAIRNDPRLLPEAKEHLINQVGLLLRIQGGPSRVVDEDPTPVTADDRAADLALRRQAKIDAKQRGNRKPAPKG